ncbi:hypothetical protein OFC37_31240, partial [Escherichia coli]|nr:hypothetical protein [Escherichia coli]
ILEDSGAKMLVVSGRKLYKHAEKAVESVERLENLIFFDAGAKQDAGKPSYELAEVESLGAEAQTELNFDIMLGDVRPDDLATIIYTSGT